MRRTRTNYAITFIITSGVGMIFSYLPPEVALLGLIVILCVQIYLTAGRLKDMNANPWWSILIILPFVGLILMFPKGTQGKNKYGEDPRTLKKDKLCWHSKSLW